MSSLALAKRSVGYEIRPFKWLKILWAPLRHAVCSASSPYLLFADESAPLSSSSFVVSNLFDEIELDQNRHQMTMTQFADKYIPVLLYGIVECSFALNIFGIHIGTFAYQIRAQFHRLDAVDQTGATIVIWFLYIGTIFHQILNDLQIGHETCTAHWRRSRIRQCIDVRTKTYQKLYHMQFSGHGRTPQGRHTVHRLIFGIFKHATLFDVRLAFVY